MSTWEFLQSQTHPLDEEGDGDNSWSDMGFADYVSAEGEADAKRGLPQPKHPESPQYMNGWNSIHQV